ncbi:hypothetical protein D3C72_984790 [compost metagenome]
MAWRQWHAGDTGPAGQCRHAAGALEHRCAGQCLQPAPGRADPQRTGRDRTAGQRAPAERAMAWRTGRAAHRTGEGRCVGTACARGIRHQRQHLHAGRNLPGRCDRRRPVRARQLAARRPGGARRCVAAGAGAAVVATAVRPAHLPAWRTQPGRADPSAWQRVGRARGSALGRRWCTPRREPQHRRRRCQPWRAGAL